jgi:nucleoside-diphosphate-sugar epimerase
MRVLVTGATGFLGRHLVLRLLDEGEQVRILARSTQRAAPLVDRGADVAIGDLSDRDALRFALRDVEVVYHLAGKLFLPGEPASAYRALHVEGTRTLLELCETMPRFTRFVHCSTTGVLGATGEVPADETAPHRPTNCYEQTKSEAERLVRGAARDGLPTVTVRPGLVYGPHDLHLLGLFRAIGHRLFRPIGSRPVWLHPIYIDDMTEAFIRCGRDPRALGECFHIAGKEPASIATLAMTIADGLGVPAASGTIPLVVARALATAGDALPARLRARAPLTRTRLDFLTHSRVYDVGKARATLDFVAETDLRTGIARTIAWYRRNGLLAAAA